MPPQNGQTGTEPPSQRADFPLRGLVKLCALWAYVHVWAPVRNLARSVAGRCHTTVLVYHRFDDSLRDSITVGAEQFRRQLELLKSRYCVLDVRDFLASRGRVRRRVGVVITFDDGYASSLLAAKLLRSAELPACFFIPTGIVGTAAALPHDSEKLGRCIPALDWDQVRRMRLWGFDFGNHTAHHVNLGTLSLEAACAEIAAGRDDLARRLGPDGAANWLAYPYGRATDISEEVRAALPTLGVKCCFSADGGVNGVNFDPMDVRRQGIDHSFTDLAFRAAVEGWKVSTPRPRPSRRARNGKSPVLVGGVIPDFLGLDGRRAVGILQWPDCFVERLAEAFDAIRAGRPVPPNLLRETNARGLIDCDHRLTGLGEKVAYHLAECARQAGAREPWHFTEHLAIDGGSRICDVGCGAGQTLSRLRRFAPDECVGVDCDIEALALGWRMQSLSGAGPVNLVCASGESLPFPDRRFTHVFSRVALNYMHQARALKEAVRVLAPGGTLYLQVENLGYDLKRLFRCRGVRAAACALYEIASGSIAALSGLQFSPGRMLAARRMFAPLFRLRRMLRQAGAGIARSKTTSRFLGFPVVTVIIAGKRPC